MQQYVDNFPPLIYIIGKPNVYLQVIIMLIGVLANLAFIRNGERNKNCPLVVSGAVFVVKITRSFYLTIATMRAIIKLPFSVRRHL